MNTQEKTERLNQLKRIIYPSDQDIEEMKQLKEELELPQNEQSERFSGTKKIESDCDCKEYNKLKDCSSESEKKPSLIQKLLFIKPKDKPKPITQSELEQLTLEARKQELIARIEKAKAQQTKAKGSSPGIFNTIQKVIGKSNYNPFDASPRSSKKGSDYNPFRW